MKQPTPGLRLVSSDGAEVVSTVTVADSLWSRFCGLMMQKQWPAGNALVIQPCNQIHMFFMKLPLDVAFVDHDGKILHACHSIKPWRASRLVRGAKAAIELPAGTLRGFSLDTGDTLRLQRAP